MSQWQTLRKTTWENRRNYINSEDLHIIYYAKLLKTQWENRIKLSVKNVFGVSIEKPWWEKS
jgi:hypothetical protein